MQRDNILLLSLDSDDGYPRLERKILAEFKTQIGTLAESRDQIGAVITGTERAFATGAEITELSKLTPAEAFEFARYGQSIMRAIESSRKPVIAAIRGYCIGGGLDLALACRARIASPDAVFAHPGASLGVITGWGGTQRLPRLIGRARAAEMLITARRIGAQDALGFGLVQKVVPAEEMTSEGMQLLKSYVRAQS